MFWLRPLLYFVLVALVFVPLEFALGQAEGDGAGQNRADHDQGRDRKQNRHRSQLTDALFATLGAVVTHALLATVLAGGFALLWQTIAPLLPRLPWRTGQLAGQALGFGLGLFLFELGGYAYHRAAHRVPILWRLHRVHHSAERLDWLATFRQHPLETLFIAAAQNLPLILLGLPLSTHVAVVLLLKLHAVFVHSDIRLPPRLARVFGWVLAGPRFHRRHHARFGTSRNYAVLFPWIDRAWGTFSAEPACEFGLRSQTKGGFLRLLSEPFWNAHSHPPDPLPPRSHVPDSPYLASAASLIDGHAIASHLKEHSQKYRQGQETEVLDRKRSDRVAPDVPCLRDVQARHSTHIRYGLHVGPIRVYQRRTMASESESPSIDDSTADASPKEPLPGAKHPGQKYVPAPGEKQLTFRAVAAGCVVGGVVACTNIYIGLKIGWTFGASIISAVLGFSLFSAMGQKLSVLETNITQTAGSGAGAMASAAGLVAAIPAMEMLGYEISPLQLGLWALSVAFLGVFFAVPLRKQMIEVDNLRFPTGSATAETILSMFAEAAEAAAKARVLIWSGVVAGAFTLIAHFIPELEMPPLEEWIPLAAIATAAAWSFKLYVGPSLFGAGFLIGPKVSLSLMLGAIIAWAILGPLSQAQGWAPGPIMSYDGGPRGWILWPGVALMVSEALATLAFSWRTFLRAFQRPKNENKGPSETDAEDDPDAIPSLWWMGGLAAGSLLTVVVGALVFDLQWWMTLIAIALSAVLAIVAVRSTGETDINPVGGMGKVTQLVYGALAPGQIAANLMAAAITGAGASQAADMMQDLKTGHLLGASPRKQFQAQLVGILAGVLFVVPVYYLFSTGYEIGGEKMPAPAAMAWKAMAELLTQGLDALPPMANWTVLGGVVIGVILSAIKKRGGKLAKYSPSGLAMGIAFIIPAFYSMVMFFGTAAWAIWRKKDKSQVARFNFALASGLIAGEGLMGVINAALTILGY